MEGDVKQASKALRDEATRRYNEEDNPLDQLRALIDSVEDLEGWFKERGLSEEEIVEECKPVIVGAVHSIATGVGPGIALGGMATFAFQLGYATKEMHTARAGENLPDPS